ncbi:MAG: NAD(P)-dependent oxidoreductase [Lachnospiraceae bacterium]|nr:NAD(P)-dependent oxidoreductase [Lachnospiraceae bacterium]
MGDNLNKKYIIIGASSFIGVYTATYFKEQGLDVYVTGRNNKFKDYYEKLGINYINLDLTRESDFEKLPKDNVCCVCLISGALPASEDADLADHENADTYIKVNVLGTCSLLEYCRKNNVKRIISTASFADLGNSLRLDPPVLDDEERNFSFTGDHCVYVISKNTSSDIMRYYNEQHGMKNVTFRLPPVYGVGPHGSLKVNGKIRKSGLQIFIDNAVEGKDIEVYGYLARDVVYVKDVAKAFYQAAVSDKACGVYNITSGVATTLEDMAKSCADVFGEEKKSKVIYHDEMENSGKSYLFSIKKAKDDFGYSPEFCDFHLMMEDYKKELDRGVFGELFKDREV